ncbi:putative HTH-type transcriptional regulator YfiR [Ensifer sp. M14]|uniref:TetR/AcrR family transcriptional regulator n=1 Tax=Ensifer sp. M14 TaxID=2203782 RepID=UPI000E1D259A|nr:TetR/AcrR family transcriptional regulator [Ensifer sp. M14]RDL50610.1 putative HTH-type transcriptional regulator YfiR [Ensifer sp. M14]
MPKISDEKRAARRAQILEAAWLCFQKQGLQATTMDDIIRASGLSAGAVYSYYPSKEELIVAAVTTSLIGLQERVEPILKSAPPSPDLFVEKITQAISDFTTREGYDLKRIALLGWSEAQRNERLRETIRGFYLAFRARLADVAVSWCNAGLLRKSASTSDVAKVVLAEILGFVVQSALLGDVEPRDMARGLQDLAAVEVDGGP